jgi:ADP-dependent NAD(P)H-hydrate dehydratase / NAD(P)H-hydrate epimerase
MRLVTAQQMRECDRRTIAGENLPAPVPGPVLMERAGWGVYAALRQHFDRLAQREILVFCGRGNNGGDGLVMARHLHDEGYRPLVLLLATPEQLAPDAAQAWARYQGAGGRAQIVTDGDDLSARVSDALRPASHWPPLLIDALLGTGTRGAPHGLAADAVLTINALRNERDAEVLAIDIPTGIDADTGGIAGDAVEADLTVALAFPKLGFLFYPGRACLGRVRVVDIGIPHAVTEAVGLAYHLMDLAEAFLLLPRRSPDAHKAEVGRLLVVGGSPGLTGAPAMAAQAALRIGAGLVTIALPRSLNPALEAKLTEVMTLPCDETGTGGLAAAAEARILQGGARVEVLAIGPGLGRDPESLRLARGLVAHFAGGVVVDADALGALSGEPWSRPVDAPAAILTPHPGEMARLIGVERIAPHDRCEVARRYAADHRCVLVLKGAPTIVAGATGETWINPTGNAGLATGGSGDVLTGVIASLLAAGLDPLGAARLGVFLHGYAADRLVESRGESGLIPTDLIDALPATMLAVDRPQPHPESALWIDADALRVP